MNPSLLNKHLPVNWENGMMMTAGHLIALNQYAIGAIHNATIAHVNPVNYGLLPCYDKNYNALEIVGDSPKEYFSVELVRCLAVTPGANILSITPETVSAGQYKKSDLIAQINLADSRERYLLLYLEIAPDYAPVGIPDPSENFDRKPRLNLSVKLKHTTLNYPHEITDRYSNSPNVLPLALYDAGDRAHPTQIKQFIPPCVSCDSFQSLAKLYDRLQKITEDMLISCTEVMKFVHEDSQKNLRSQVAVDMSVILPPIIQSLIHINSQFKTSLRYESPVRLVQVFKQLAIAVSSSYFPLHLARRRELARYFADFHGVPGDFMDTTGAVENAEYAHVNIYHSCFEHILKFLKMYADLFKEMSEKGLKTSEFAPGTYREDTPQQPAYQPEPTPALPPPPPPKTSSDDDDWGMILG